MKISSIFVTFLENTNFATYVKAQGMGIIFLVLTRNLAEVLLFIFSHSNLKISTPNGSKIGILEWHNNKYK